MTDETVAILSLFAFIFTVHCIHSYAAQKLFLTGKQFLLKHENQTSEPKLREVSYLRREDESIR